MNLRTYLKHLVDSIENFLIDRLRRGKEVKKLLRITRNDWSLFKLIALITVNGSLNVVFRHRGTSSTTRMVYLMCPYVPSIDDGIFDGIINSNA